ALAAGAYAGIPLTQRNTSSSLLLVTGHEDPQKHELQVDWRQLGALKNTTLAIYMGMGRLPEILRELQAGGLPATTPAAAVQWASLGRQRSVTGTAADLPQRVAQAGLGAPAIVFVGEVVRHQETVDWFEHLPLFGRRIAITRHRDGNSELRSQLEHLGSEVLELPLIRVVPHVDKQVLFDVLSELGSYDWIVFTSPNGVRVFFDQFFRIYDEVRNLGLLRFACVGEATAREIKRHHIKVEVQPETATAAALADALIATGSLDSARIIVVTGNLNRDDLVQRLEAAQAIVDRLPLYQTEKPELAEQPVVESFRQHGADAVLFASSSAVEAFAAQAKQLRLEPNAKRPIAGSIGPQTSATMKSLGLPIDFEAASPGIDALIAALVRKLA
ncbi:MAG TPA: uroporphyrinogen-III synthase, partial [Candidatus Synoicihabitans sp.]|nr:uroporphyrinogen-III synthase [Candidatus Synoicihabitans sp.]